MNASHNSPSFIPPIFNYLQLAPACFRGAMKYTWLGCLLVGGLLLPEPRTPISMSTRAIRWKGDRRRKGWNTNVADQQNDRISSGLRKDLLALIGQKLNPAMLDGLATRLKKEFSARAVSHHMLRGDSPEYVRVVFEIQPRQRLRRHRPQVPVQLQAGLERRRLGGLHRPAEQLYLRPGQRRRRTERALRRHLARYENKHLGTDRVGLRFQFESYHQQWNQQHAGRTGAAPDRQPSTPIATRQNFEPTATFVWPSRSRWKWARLSSDFRTSFRPRTTEAANALITALRYHRRLADREYPAGPGRRLQPARGHQGPGQRFRLRLAHWPGCTTAWPTASTVDRRRHRRADQRPGAAVRALRGRQQLSTCADGTSTKSIRSAETGWSTTPSSIGMARSRCSTMPARFGTAGNPPSCATPSGVGFGRRSFPWPWLSRSGPDRSSRSSWWA